MIFAYEWADAIGISDRITSEYSLFVRVDNVELISADNAVLDQPIAGNTLDMYLREIRLWELPFCPIHLH